MQDWVFRLGCRLLQYTGLPQKWVNVPNFRLQNNHFIDTHFIGQTVCSPSLKSHYNISCKWIVEQKTVSIFWIGIHKRYSILYSTTITILSIFVFPLLEHYWHYDLFYGYNGFVYLITEIWESSKHHEMIWEQLHNGKKSIKINSGPETFIFSVVELIEIFYTLL